MNRATAAAAAVDGWAETAAMEEAKVAAVEAVMGQQSLLGMLVMAEARVDMVMERVAGAPHKLGRVATARPASA